MFFFVGYGLMMRAYIHILDDDKRSFNSFLLVRVFVELFRMLLMTMMMMIMVQEKLNDEENDDDDDDDGGENVEFSVIQGVQRNCSKNILGDDF